VDLPGYSNWASESNLPVEFNRLEQDFDGDGFSNLHESVLGTRGDNPEDLPATRLGTGNNTAFLTMSYPRLNGGRMTPEGYRVGDFLYTPQGSLDLINWDTPTSTTSPVHGLAALPRTHHWSTFRLSNPMAGQDRGFLRLQIRYQCEEH
jgi:hypothetical protein